MHMPSELPLVTIAIPTYKRAGGYLRETLASALAQTYPNLEILVCDNCSPDDTEAYVRSFTDTRLHYFRHSAGLAPNDNFNFGLQQARGAYFLLLHDDDLIDPDFVEVCLRAAEYRIQAGLIQTGVRRVDEHGQTLHESVNYAGGLSTPEYFHAWFHGRISWYLCNTLFHTERLRAAGGFGSRHQLTQDGVAIVKLAPAGRVDVAAVKASFRKHGAELTFAAKVRHWCEDYQDLLALMCTTVGPEAARLRREGERFLSRVNYGRARAVKHPLERLRAYLAVWRAFGYRFSPLEFWLEPQWRWARAWVWARLSPQTAGP
jgi:glycosyltransferase involved in cell wall biosynthesis